MSRERQRRVISRAEIEFRQGLILSVAQGLCANSAETQSIALQAMKGGCSSKDLLAKTTIDIVDSIFELECNHPFYCSREEDL